MQDDRQVGIDERHLPRLGMPAEGVAAVGQRQIAWNGDGVSPGRSGAVRIHAVVAPGPGLWVRWEAHVHRFTVEPGETVTSPGVDRRNGARGSACSSRGELTSELSSVSPNTGCSASAMW